MAKQYNAYCLQERQAGCVLVGTPDQLVFLNQDEKRPLLRIYEVALDSSTGRPV